MKCQDVRKMLSAYSDGESRAEKKTLIESHVRACESCQKVIEENQVLWDVLGVLPAAKASPFFYARLKSKMQRSKLQAEERARRIPWTERLLIPASAAAIAVLGFWLGTIAGGNGDTQQLETATQNSVASTTYFDTFNSVPSASFGDVYFAMAGQE
jgi:predicted anti-sigma-YlaC factor YlaD